MNDEDATEPAKAFIIGPIGEPSSAERRWADDVRKHVIDKALLQVDPPLKSYRSDSDSTPGSITPQMITELVTARVVIADLTGRNPNCYYELGVAHAFERPVITLISSITELPFDAKDLRTIPILRTESDDGLKLGATEADDAATAVLDQLKIALADGYRPFNPVTDAALNQSLDRLAPDDPKASEITELRRSMDNLTRLVSEQRNAGFFTRQLIPQVIENPVLDRLAYTMPGADPDPERATKDKIAAEINQQLYEMTGHGWEVPGWADVTGRSDLSVSDLLTIRANLQVEARALGLRSD